MKNIQIRGSVVLVTGSNKGIGKAFVEELIKRGAAKVYAGARNPSLLKELVDSTPDKIIPLKLDVTKADEIQAAASAASDVNILINNAGRADYAAIVGGPDISSARGEMEVNYFGVLNVVRAFIPILKKNGSGQIINISSVAGLVGVPMLGTYSATKAALHSLTQCLRAELASQEIAVMGVYPGPIDTDMAKDFDMEKESPSNVANAVLDGAENGAEDIFPDKVSAEVAKGLKADAKAVEKQWGQMLPQTSPSST